MSVVPSVQLSAVAIESLEANSLANNLQSTNTTSEIENQATTALHASPYRSVRRLSCKVSDRVLILRGRVPNFFLKQMAQTLVIRFVKGGMVIDNQVEVDAA